MFYWFICKETCIGLINQKYGVNISSLNLLSIRPVWEAMLQPKVHSVSTEPAQGSKSWLIQIANVVKLTYFVKLILPQETGSLSNTSSPLHLSLLGSSVLGFCQPGCSLETPGNPKEMQPTPVCLWGQDSILATSALVHSSTDSSTMKPQLKIINLYYLFPLLNPYIPLLRVELFYSRTFISNSCKS